MTNITLREYQKEAVAAYIKNNYKGIFAMATGTGKTLTALECINVHFNINERQFVVIIVPFIHLIDQWVKDFEKINIHNYITVAYSKAVWYTKLKNQIWEYNRGFRDRIVVIGSYKSMASQEFQSLVESVMDDRLLVSDECHYLGSPSYINSNFSKFESALGLSATPRRWWDDAGTSRIFSIFDRIVYKYSMDEAINNNYLSPYYYYPKLIPLTDDELAKYESLSSRIGRFLGESNISDEKYDSLEKLLRKRAAIVQTASCKMSMLVDLIRKQDDKRHTLVYCSPGEIDKVVKLISNLSIKVHRFNSELNNNERRVVLDLFQKGEIEVLVAIKCLDEGVDIPATRNAYFLASTSNPREFVQRRGRILRKSAGKTHANIYDFITIQDDISYNTFNSLAKRELPRYAEFANSALNKYQERQQLRQLLSKYNLEMYLNITPWQMYEILKEENGGYNEFTRRYH